VIYFTKDSKISHIVNYRAYFVKRAGGKMKLQTEADRFNLVLQKSGLSKKDFATSLGLSQSQASNIFRGIRKPSRETLDRLALLHGVDLNWFISGFGGTGGGHETISVELIDQQAAAGRGIVIEDYAEKHSIPVPASIIAPHRPNNLKAVYVKGDSMVNEKICDGDVVVFCPGMTWGDNLYVLSVGGAVLVKRVAFDELRRAITLISANPAYSPRRISGGDLESVKIEGRVIACLHRMA
jgi:SOS-response transcriptional repressor LexA